MDRDKVVHNLFRNGVLSLTNTIHTTMLMDHNIVKQAHIVFPAVYAKPCADVWEFLVRYAKAFPTTTADAEIKHVMFLKTTHFMEVKLKPILGNGRLVVTWHPAPPPPPPPPPPSIVKVEEAQCIRVAKRKLAAEQELLDFKRKIVEDGSLLKTIGNWKKRIASPDASSTDQASINKFSTVLEKSFGITKSDW